jgi:hypothetical protein
MLAHILSITDLSIAAATVVCLLVALVLSCHLGFCYSISTSLPFVSYQCCHLLFLSDFSFLLLLLSPLCWFRPSLCRRSSPL